MSGEFPFNAEQKSKLQEITNGGKGNYADGYDYLHQQIQTFLDAPENAGHPDRQAYKNINYWLEKAAEINRNDPKSEANAYIREVTRSGLLFDGKSADPAKVQENSDLIGKTVMGDIADKSFIPSLDALLQHDVQSAIGLGGQTLAGWGGSFYYWNIPMSKEPGDTVGNRIMSDPAEYEKFLAVSTKAAIETMARLGMSFEQFQTAFNAQVPEKVMSEIMDRTASVLDYGDGQSDYMGNPNEIGGYRASIGADGKVSWYHLDKDLKRVPLQDEVTVSNLNARRNLRLEKGINHPWQAPSTEARVDKITLNDGTVYERTYGADGRIQQTVKTNPDGTRMEKAYDPANGNVTQEKRFDKDGKLTYDSVDEASKKAEIDKKNAALAAQPTANQIATFDTQYYLNKNPDIADTNNWKSTAFEHFKNHGWKEGRKPNQWFDPRSYLDNNPDIVKAGLNPFEHWRDHGFVEGRKPYNEYIVPPTREQNEIKGTAEPEVDRIAREKAEVDRAAADKLRADQAAQAAAMAAQQQQAEQSMRDLQKRQEDERKRSDEAAQKLREDAQRSMREAEAARQREDAQRREREQQAQADRDRNQRTGGGRPGTSIGGGNSSGSGINVCFPSTGQCSRFPVFMDMNRDGVIDVMPLADKQNVDTSLSPVLSINAVGLNENIKATNVSLNSTDPETSTAHFDWNADGIPDPTAWVGPKDGMLVIDLAKGGETGADGMIDQPREIAFALWKTEDERVAELKEKGIDDTGRPVTDLEGLRWAFDTNHDNVLDSRDERWKEFRVWQDANQNGVTDTGELMTMDQAGIKLINLMPSSDGSKAFPDGSAITGTSTAQMTDGTKMLVGDVTLAYRPSLAS